MHLRLNPSCSLPEVNKVSQNVEGNSTPHWLPRNNLQARYLIGTLLWDGCLCQNLFVDDDGLCSRLNVRLLEQGSWSLQMKTVR